LIASIWLITPGTSSAAVIARFCAIGAPSRLLVSILSDLVLLRSGRGVDDLLCGDNRGEFAVEISGGYPGDFVRWNHHAIRIGVVERARRVDNKLDRVSKVSGKPCRLFATEIRRDPANHQRRVSACTQPTVKVGFAVESGVHRLGDEQIVGTVDSRLKVVTRLARSQR
jgi:hypothetical protein